MTNLIANGETLRAVRAKMNATLNPYASRAEFEGAVIPPAVLMVYVIDGRDVYALIRDPAGDWTSFDGAKWTARIDGGLSSEAIAEAVTATETARGEAVAAATLSAAYAQTPEDTTVPGGAGYSALHYAAKAAAARVLAETARDASLLSRGLFASTAQGIGRGLREVVKTAGGTGGTDGTATWVASGGTATIVATGTATIAGGAVVDVTVDQPGLYTVDPTGITLTGAGSLTGFTYALTVGVNTPVDGYFTVLAPATDEAVIYRVDAGPVAVVEDRLLTSAFLAKFAETNGYLDPDHLFMWKDAAGNIVGKVALNAEWDILLKSLKSSAVEIYDYQTIGGDTPFIVTDALGQILYEAPAPNAVDPSVELAAARGTAVDLNTRLSKSLSPSGLLLTPSFGRETLRNAHYKLTKRRISEATQFNIAAVGDSYTQNYDRWSGPAATILAAAYGDGGGGWTGYGWFGAAGGPWVYPGTQPSGINGNARPALYGLAFSGAWTCAYNSSDGPDLSSVTSPSAGAYIRRTVPAAPDHTALRVVFIGTADGVLRYRVDGGSWTTQNVQGTVGDVQSFDIALTAGAHVIEMEVVSGTVTLCGDNALSSASGVRFHKLGGSGANINHWTSRNEARQLAGWQLLAIDTFVVLDGTNSQVSFTPDAWGTLMTTLIGRLRAAANIPDVLLVMPPENMRANTYPMPLFAAVGREVAASLGTGYLDLQRSFGLATADYASASARPLFNADGIHPEPATGGRVMAAEILNLITP